MSTAAIAPTRITVRSESRPDVTYTVTIDGEGATCDCPHAPFTDEPCKHARPILAELADVLGEAPAWRRGAREPSPAATPTPALADDHLAAQRALEADPSDAAARQAARALEWREREEAIREPDSDTAGIRLRVAKALGGWGVAVTEELAQLARDAGLEVIPPTVAEVEAAAAEFEAASSPSLGSIRQRHAWRARYDAALEAGFVLRARATACREGCTEAAYQAALAEHRQNRADQVRYGGPREATPTPDTEAAA